MKKESYSCHNKDWRAHYDAILDLLQNHGVRVLSFSIHTFSEIEEHPNPSLDDVVDELTRHYPYYLDKGGRESIRDASYINAHWWHETYLKERKERNYISITYFIGYGAREPVRKVSFITESNGQRN